MKESKETGKEKQDEIVENMEMKVSEIGQSSQSMEHNVNQQSQT
jgi:hypothetical protein